MNNNSSDISKKIRVLSVNQLKALNALLSFDQNAVESTNIGAKIMTANNSGTAGVNLGGVISSLTRSKIDGLPLAEVVAKNSDRIKYIKYNSEIASKDSMYKAVKIALKDFE